MKLRGLPRLIASLLLVCALFTGCTDASAPSPTGGGATPGISGEGQDTQDTQDTSDTQDTPNANSGAIAGNPLKVTAVAANPLIAPVYGEEDAAAQAAADGANDFAFRLSAALAAKSAGKNLVASPFSVWMPLAALVNATDEAHRDTLLETLGAAGITMDDINNAASRLLYDLTNQAGQDWAAEYGEDSHNPLAIANAIFVDSDVTLKQDFAQTFMDYYRGSVMNVQFSSQEAVDAVNRWASENTDGLINEIIQSFDPDTVAALANAIYFSDRWSHEFNLEDTTEDVFHAPDGDTSAFFMLREGDDQTYYEDDRLQAMPLRFKTGGGMYILLPKDGDAAGLLASMTDEYFKEIQTNSISSTGKLLLPRFSIAGETIPLKETLEALGVPLFDRETAPLTGGLLEEEIPVWLSAASHRAVIEVDERGTTAAAVTVIAASTSSMPLPTEPFEMRCDSPFVFVLYGNTYDGGQQVLFTGMVNQP